MRRSNTHRFQCDSVAGQICHVPRHWLLCSGRLEADVAGVGPVKLLVGQVFSCSRALRLVSISDTGPSHSPHDKHDATMDGALASPLQARSENKNKTRRRWQTDLCTGYPLHTGLCILHPSTGLHQREMYELVNGGTDILGVAALVDESGFTALQQTNAVHLLRWYS